MECNIIDHCYTDLLIFDDYEDKDPKYMYRIKGDISESKVLIINDQKYCLFKKLAKISGPNYSKELFYVVSKNIMNYNY